MISQGAVTTVGVYIQTQIIGSQYPQGAASAVLLVLILILGVFAITRFSNLREDVMSRRLRPRDGADAGQGRQAAARSSSRDWAKWGLATYFVIFLIFLYAPMILMAILSFQGYYGGVTFPFRGPAGLDWWRSIFQEQVGHSHLHERGPIRAAGERSLCGQPGRGRDRRVHGLHPLDGVPPPLPRRRPRLLRDPARADDAGIPARPRHADLLEVDGRGRPRSGTRRSARTRSGASRSASSS